MTNGAIAAAAEGLLKTASSAYRCAVTWQRGRTPGLVVMYFDSLMSADSVQDLRRATWATLSSRRRRWDGGSVMRGNVGCLSQFWVTRTSFGPRDKVIYSGYLASITLRSPPRAANSPVTLAQTGRQDATTSCRIRFTAFS